MTKELPLNTTVNIEDADTNDLVHKVAKELQNKNKNKKLDNKWNAALGPYPVVSPGTREASFVHAISSAGVAHAVTRSCSSGELENCGCDRSLRGMSPEGFQVYSFLYYFRINAKEKKSNKKMYAPLTAYILSHFPLSIFSSKSRCM